MPRPRSEQEPAQVDPGPFQIWEDWGQGWYLVGVLNVTVENDTRVERWAFTHFDQTTNPTGFHHPSKVDTTVYWWFGRLDASFGGTNGAAPTSGDDLAFQNWALGTSSTTGALAKLHGWYSQSSGSIAMPDLFTARVSCQSATALGQCNLGPVLTRDGVVLPPPPSAPAATPGAVPAPH